MSQKPVKKLLLVITPFLLLLGSVLATTPAPADVPTGTVAVTFTCKWSHQALDDPIVNPGADAAHNHEFFGNTSTNRFSTYESMTAASGLCNQGGDTAAYWAPSLLDANGKRIQPIRIRVYYSNEPVSAGPVKAFPPDFRVIAGYPHAFSPDPNSFYGWSCANENDLIQNVTKLNCAGRGHISVRAFFPSCWDGVLIDSVDHRSHVVYPQLNGVDRSRRGTCPSTHPIHVPRIRVIMHFPNDTCPGCRLVSDMPGDIPGSTFHVDFWNTWQQDALEAFVATLVDDGT